MTLFLMWPVFACFWIAFILGYLLGRWEGRKDFVAELRRWQQRSER